MLHMLAPSAFLSSAASTAELTSSLLPPWLRGIKDSHLPVAVTEWMKLATSSSSTTSSLASSDPREWDDSCCQVLAEELLNAATDQAERARLLASCSLGSGEWLDALPLSSVGLKMDNATVRIAVGLRLGAPIVRTHVCVCATMVTVDGHHGLSCRRGSVVTHGTTRPTICSVVHSLALTL